MPFVWGMKTQTSQKEVVHVDARSLADILKQVVREELSHLNLPLHKEPDEDPPKIPLPLAVIPQTNPTPQPEQFIGVVRGAEVLGISVQTLYSYTSRSIVPFYKKAKRIFFKERELLEWLDSGRNKSLGEIQKEASTRPHPKKGGGTE